MNYLVMSKINVLDFYFTYYSSMLKGKYAFEGCFFQIRSKKSLKTRPNSPYGEETSSYSLLQQGVFNFGIVTM